MKFQRAASIVLMTMAIILIAGELPVTGDVKGQVAGPLELNMMSLYFAEGMELDPLLPATDEYQAISIPNGFIKDGFRGLNLLPVGHTYWKTVGTWYTQPLKQKINLGGLAEVNIYTYKPEGSEGGSPSSDFRFEIMRGNEVLLDLFIGGVRITEGTDTLVTVTGSFPPGNDTTIEPGTSLALRITAKCNGGGAMVKFGSTTYKSGFTFGSNALQIHTIHMGPHHVVLEYKDAFMVPWTKLHTELTLDRVIIPNMDMSSLMNSVNMTRELHWDRENKPGEYEMFISLGYSPEQNISQQFFLKIPKVNIEWFKLGNIGNMVQNNSSIVVIVILALAGLVMYSRYRGRLWNRRVKLLSPDIRKKERASQKTAWKEMDAKRRQRWKVEREKKVIEEEDDVDEIEDAEFRIFKRKNKKGAPTFRPEELDDDQPMDDIEL